MIIICSWEEENMPSISGIVEYWSQHEDECGLAVNWSDAHGRCGYHRHLQKCHIIPHALGGPNAPHNLVLLCLQCHREAPNSANPDYMWQWLRSNYAQCYDTYWHIRGLEEFERMFDRKPFEGITEYISEDNLKTAVGDEMQRAVIHGGEAGLNPATIACVVAELEKSLRKQLAGAITRESAQSVAP